MIKMKLNKELAILLLVINVFSWPNRRSKYIIHSIRSLAI